MLSKYIEITKPGIIRGNLIVAIAAYIYASVNSFDWQVFLALVIGISLVIGSAAVANNIVDKKIDSMMSRTKKRALAAGTIGQQQAAVYSLILGLLGLVILFYYVNWLVGVIGLFSFISYVFVYGYFKRTSVNGTLVGTIPGAAPPVAGYVAVTGTLDWVAAMLFLLLVFWQMPHFYAIAIFRKMDYKKAKLPVLPIVKGDTAAKRQSLVYIGLFVFFNGLLFAFGEAGYSYIVGMLALNIWWAKIAFDGFKANDDEIWAKKMFKVSLMVLLGFSLLLATDNILP